MVARVRGVHFVLSAPGAQTLIPIARDVVRAFDAMRDVAHWLGYETYAAYNRACDRRPEEVEVRLRAPEQLALDWPEIARVDV
jgi:hypothetical protein